MFGHFYKRRQCTEYAMSWKTKWNTQQMPFFCGSDIGKLPRDKTDNGIMTSALFQMGRKRQYRQTAVFYNLRKRLWTI